MGHLVNPISFRLGITQTWKSQWFVSGITEYALFLKDDFILYNYIESFFKYSKIRKRNSNSISRLNKLFFNNDFSRERRGYNLYFYTKRFRHLRRFQLRRIKMRRFFTNKLVTALSLIYSHLNVSRSPENLSLIVNIYDGSFNKQLLQRLGSLSNIERVFHKKYTFAAERVGPSLNKKFYKYQLINFLFFEKLVLFSLAKFNINYFTKIKAFGLELASNFVKKNLRLLKFLWFIFSSNFTFLLKSQKIFLIRSLLAISFFLKKAINKIYSFFQQRFLNSRFIVKFLKRKNFIGRKNALFLSKIVLDNFLFSRLKQRYLINNFFKRYLQSAKQFIGRIVRKKQSLFLFNKYITHYYFLKWNIPFFSRFKLKMLMKKHKLKWLFLNKFFNFRYNLKFNKLFFNLRYSSNILTLISLHFIKLLHSTNFAKSFFYRYRFKIWYFVTRILYENIKSLTLKSFFFSSKFKKLNFIWCGLNNKQVTAQMVANYISTKINQKYTIFEVLRPMVKDLTSNKTVRGFKISCAGRLTRKQRASIIIHRTNAVSLNSLKSYVDYGTSISRLRHGVCGIKVWIDKKKSFKPFFYRFTFSFSLVNVY